MMIVYYFLAVVAIWLGIASLRGGLRFASYVHREMAAPMPDYQPFVSVILPFRGLDDGFSRNIAAFLQQKYPEYEVIFVTDRADDPGVEALRSLLSDKLQFVAGSGILS